MLAGIVNKLGVLLATRGIERQRRILWQRHGASLNGRGGLHKSKVDAGGVGWILAFNFEDGNFGFQFETGKKNYLLEAYTPEGYHTLTDDAVRLEVIARLHEEVAHIAKTAEMRERLAAPPVVATVTPSTSGSAGGAPTSDASAAPVRSAS